MVKVTQETFDQAVQENIEILGLTPEEAVQEAVQQFETQGVDLSTIFKDLMSSRSEKTKAVVDAVIKLDELKKARALKPPEEYLEQLAIIKVECDKGLTHRVAAGKEGAYHVILDTMLRLQDNDEVRRECLRSMVSLMTKQPDLLDEKGIATIVDYLQRENDEETLKLLLKWIKEACIMHEENRQKLFNNNIMDLITQLLRVVNHSVLRLVLAIMRALTLDDDVRVEFGLGHERARVMASDTLCAICDLLKQYQSEEPLMNDLMLTLSALVVRSEYCTKVEDAGGLEFIKVTMTSFSDNEKLMRQCLKLLKALAGNDDCKVHIIQKGFAPLIASAISATKTVSQTAIAGLACVAALTLRSPENSQALFTNGLPAIIIECMNLHPEDMNVQRNGSWAIRNMVSRSRYQTQHFIKLGAEGVLNRDLSKFKNCEYDFKAALRDLGCQVELNEEWTGKGGMINTEGKH